MASVRSLFVDEFEPWRRAACAILQQNKHLEVIGEGSDGLEAIQKSEELQPDLVLLEIRLASLNGLEAARQIRTVSPGSKILFLTLEDSPDFVQEALRVGALGYVIKSDAASNLLPAVRAVMHNQRFVPRRFSHIAWMIQDS